LPSAAGGKGKGQTAGQLHNETAYGLTDEIDAKGNTIVVHRKMLSGFTEKDIDFIRDEELKARLFDATRGKTGKDFTTALLDFAKTDAKFKGVRHVRVAKGLAVIPISDRNGIPYKGYMGGANYRYDVWELQDGKWEVEVVSMFDAHQKGWVSAMLATDERGRRVHHNARKVMSLQQNDMVAYELEPGQRIVARVRKFGQNRQVWFDAHNEAGKLDDRHNDKDDPFRDFSKLPGGLKAIRLRQVRVDETGQVFDPGPQDHASRVARKQKAVG
jgi:CRISPR-associated endonuclease Csn1